MGSVRRAPGGRPGWQAQYRDPSGRGRTKTFPSKADAAAFLRAAEVDVDRGAFIDPMLGKTTFGEYAASWLATKADVSPRTLINVEGRLRNHCLPAFGATPLARIQPSDVRAFVAALTAQGLAPATVKAALLTLAQVLRTAVMDGYIARSPCAGVEPPSDRHREQMHFLEAGQVDLLAAAIDDRYRALVYLAAYGGLRAGELVALKVASVNTLAGTLEISEAASEVRGRLTVGPTKTGRVRRVALPRFLAEMLGAHIGEYPSADGFLFTAPEGGPLRWRNFSALRHTCAALLIANGRHMEEVKDHLGHSSIRVTSDRYGHLFPQARQELADSLDATYNAGADARDTASRRTGVVQGADVQPIDVASGRRNRR
jgi:integrase